jgi:glycosyltransferase involved in cell wall biosynthesis
VAPASGPLVTVAMPFLNCEGTIVAAVRSILMQSYENWELLLLDDGSTDQSLARACEFRDPRIQVLSDGVRRGVAPRLNQSIELSRGKYYARMDADDVAYPQRLERQLDFMESHPEVDLVGTWMMVFGRAGVPVGKRGGLIGQSAGARLARTLPVGHPTFFGRTSWFRRHGYEAWAAHFQDQHLLYSTSPHSTFAVLPEILLGYREEALSLRKQARYRWCYVSVFPSLRRSIGLAAALSLASFNLIKLAVDAFAISTRLNYRVLRSRARPITEDERHQWNKVWTCVSKEAVDAS